MAGARIWGIASALIAAATFGAVNVAARHAIADGVQPLWMTAFLYLGGGIAMLPFARKARLTRAERPRMAVVVVAGAIAAPILLFFGLARTAAADASLILNLEMVFTAILALTLLRERLAWREALGILLLGAAAVVVSLASGARGGSTLVGVALVAGAAFLWSVDNTASTPLARVHDARGLIAIKTLVGGSVVVLAAWSLEGAPGGALVDWGIGIAAGILGVALSSVLFYRALASIGAARTTVLFATSALWGVGFAALLLHESLGWIHLAAALLVVAGLGTMAWGARNTPVSNV